MKSHGTGGNNGDIGRSVRIAAAHAMLTSAAGIQEISTAVGISDANYFARIFKQTYGVTPSQYRKQRGV